MWEHDSAVFKDLDSDAFLSLLLSSYLLTLYCYYFFVIVYCESRWLEEHLSRGEVAEGGTFLCLSDGPID